MTYDLSSQTLTARDGTTIAWHTHRSPNATAATAAHDAKRPTLVLTNGVGTSENFWRFLVEDFAPDHRVVHWNYRGHARSGTSPRDDYSIEAHADDLARVTEAVMAEGDGLTAPVHVGFSMGVTVLLELYRRRPDLVRALVLLAGPPDAPFATTLPLRVPGAMTAVRAAMRAVTPTIPVIAPAMRALFASPVAYPTGRALGLLQPRAPREDVESFLRELGTMDPRAFWLAMRGLFEAHASDVLPLVKVPTLVIAAENDTMVPRSQIDRMKRAIKHAEYVLVRNAGHASLLEAGDEIALVIRRFLATHVPREPWTPKAVARSAK